MADSGEQVGQPTAGQPTADRADTADRWTIRGVSRATQRKAADMAAKADVRLGEWLTQVIERAADTADMADAPPDTLAGLRQRVAVIEAAMADKANKSDMAWLEVRLSALSAVADKGCATTALLHSADPADIGRRDGVAVDLSAVADQDAAPAQLSDLSDMADTSPATAPVSDQADAAGSEGEIVALSDVADAANRLAPAPAASPDPVAESDRSGITGQKGSESARADEFAKGAGKPAGESPALGVTCLPAGHATPTSDDLAGTTGHPESDPSAESARAPADDFASRLAVVIKDRGMSQSAADKAAELAHATVNKIIRRTMPASTAARAKLTAVFPELA